MLQWERGISAKPCGILFDVWNGFVAYRGKENEEAYRDEGSRQKEKSHNGDDFHRDCLRLCLMGNIFHLMGHMLHLCC